MSDGSANAGVGGKSWTRASTQPSDGSRPLRAIGTRVQLLLLALWRGHDSNFLCVSTCGDKFEAVRKLFSPLGDGS
ncbi:MAG: hypothetical protein COB30_017055 [Ectothiorhodospiraceae bacterium]|nr:hypothetical protein [Ectothiorhodospiraceae bacterium]